MRLPDEKVEHGDWVVIFMLTGLQILHTKEEILFATRNALNCHLSSFGPI